MFCLIVVPTISPALALAQSTPEGSRKPDVYSIYDIQVDETARNVSRARNAALLKGQREALQRLLTKILRAEDMDKLPYFDDRQVRDLISGFEILDERNSDVRYIATLAVQFNRDKVFDLLSLLQIPFAETLSAPVTVLPVLQKDGADFLWEDLNGWKAAWEARTDLNSLVPVTVPPSSLSQHVLITSWQAQAGLPSSLAKFAETRGVRDLVVAVASLERDLVRNRYDMTLTLRRGMEGEIVHRERLEAGAEEQELPGAEIPRLYEKGIAATMDYLNRVWREKVLVHFGVAASVRVTAHFANMEEWLTIQRRLSALPLVRKVQLRALTLDQAELAIDHAGEYEQLLLTLRQKGLRLEEGGEEEGQGANKILRLEAGRP